MRAKAWFRAVLIGGLCACGDPFTAGIELTLINAPNLGLAGGYRIELRQPDGRPLDGATHQFIATKAGDQTLGVIFEKDTLFAQGDTAIVRLYVEAARSRTDPTLAIASKVIALEKDKTIPVLLTFAEDPREDFAGSTFVAGYTSGAANALTGRTLAVTGTFPALSDWQWHLWKVDGGGAKTWVAKLDENNSKNSFALAQSASLITSSGLSFEITVEPTDSSAMPLRSNGFRVFAGALSETNRAALAPLLTPETSAVAVANEFVGIIVGHAELAQQSQQAADFAGVRLHSEHVYNTVAGTTFAADLDGVNGLDFVSNDRSGLSIASDLSYGRLGQIAAAATTFVENSPQDSVTSVRTGTRANLELCITHMRTHATTLLQIANDLDITPTDTVKMIQLTATAGALNGDAFDAAASASQRQSLRCVLATLEQLSAFALSPVPVGTP